MVSVHIVTYISNEYTETDSEFANRPNFNIFE